ncbi:MAG: O-antigen ligase family protein [Desulfobulbaceae bacterium]
MTAAILRKISCALFVFLLLFSPLAFGTVENWSYFVLETVTGLSWLLLCLSLVLGEARPLAVPGRVPLFLLLGYMLVHLLPLPLPLIKFFSPATFEIYRPLLELDPGITSIPLTLNRQATLLQLLTTSAYVLFYLLTVQLCSRAEWLKRTVSIVVTLGIAIGVEAILQKLTSAGTIYWFRATPNTSPVGPWVYSNHFAGFMEMVFPVAIALFLYYRPRVEYDTSLREKWLAILTLPGANRHLLLGSGAILMAVSILLSVSRGGIITLCMAFFFFVLFSARTTADPRTRWAMLLTVLVILLVTWFGWEPITSKFGKLWGEQGLDTSGRLPVAQDSLEIIRSFPLTGSGFGTFLHVYPMVRTVAGDAVFDHAHNDYIEVMADGGIIGLLLCAWFVVSVLAHAIRTLARRRDRYSILLASGSLTGMLALLFHSLADFQMYNGANGLYFFFLCGLTVSAVNTRLQYRNNHTLLHHAGRINLALPALLAIFLLAGSSWYRIQSVKAERLALPLQTIFLNRHLPPERLRGLHALAGRAAALDPLNPLYPATMGHISTLMTSKKQAELEYLQATLLQPTSGLHLQQLSTSLATSDTNRTEVLLAVGLRREPLILDRYLFASDWFLSHDLRKKAHGVLKQALIAIPWRTTDTMRFMLRRGLTTDELKDILPPMPAAWHEAGKRLERSRPDEAVSFYLRAVDLLDKEKVAAEYFSRPYFLLLRENKDSSALEILRRGIRTLPEHAPFRVLLGDYYLRQKIPYRALEEYRQALTLDPGNREVRRKIELLNQE